LKFYSARVKYADGDRSHPLSLFAENIDAAMESLIGGWDYEVVEVTIRERPIEEAASVYGRAEVGTAVVEHPSIEWKKDLL
jgi:hypothetical protein